MIEETIKEPIVVTETPTVQVPPLPQVQSVNEEITLPPVEPQKPAKKKLFLSLMIALVLLIAASLGVYLWLGTKLNLRKSDQSQTQPTPVPTVTNEEIQELEAIEIGDVDSELENIESDLSNL